MFTAHSLNILLGTLEVDVDSIKKLNIKAPYADTHHLLCGNHSISRWKCQKGSNIHLILLFSHMHREARIWEKIIYTCFIHRTHMTELNVIGYVLSIPQCVRILM